MFGVPHWYHWKCVPEPDQTTDRLTTFLPLPNHSLPTDHCLSSLHYSPQHHYAPFILIHYLLGMQNADPDVRKDMETFLTKHVPEVRDTVAEHLFDCDHDFARSSGHAPV